MLERGWEEYSSDESRTYDCEVDVCALQDLRLDEDWTVEIALRRGGCKVGPSGMRDVTRGGIAFHVECFL